MRGLDVFRDHLDLKADLRSATVRHWAPNCSTFSRARERPIPGVKCPPKPLRNDSFPKGIPEVVVSLPQSKRRKLELDTQMADMAARDCELAHADGRYFSLEHPKNSIARGLESWRRLEGLEGVSSTEYHACMFEGCKRRKSQVLIHNIPGMGEAIGRKCGSSNKCSRTQTAHQSWKPLVRNGKVLAFATSEEREYSRGFCEAYAAALNSLPGSQHTFLEIFSGRNAPLSHAVGRSWGVEVPGPKAIVGSKGDAVELSELPKAESVGPSPLAQLQSAGVNDDSFMGVPRSSGAARLTGVTQQPLGSLKQQQEVNPYRLAAVQAGKQPSYGKRAQLIPDGLGSPIDHLSLAKKAEHPFDSLSVLKEDHRRALQALAADPQRVVADRFTSLDKLRQWSSELSRAQRNENAQASWTAQKLGLKPKTVLMKRLQRILHIEDTDVPQACLDGLRITGEASVSPFFESFPVPPSMGLSEFHSQKHARSSKMIERVQYMGQKGPPELAQAIWEKTLKEVSQGTMGPPMNWEEVVEKYQDDFQITPSFGLEQGSDEHGAPKFRRIDDHSASGVNPSAHRLQKVPMSMIDYVGVMLRSISQSCCEVSMATEDMKGAYRQVPLAPCDVRYSITAVWNPATQKVHFFEMFGQPFGAGHAVPNFCRVAEWLCRFLQRFFYLHVDHFFDDFFAIEPSITLTSGMFVMREAFKTLGFTPDPDKSQPPAQICAILGVLFNTALLAAERKFSIAAKPSRLSNLESLIRSVLEKGELSPSLAASLVGKFGFLCSTLFGKVGRCCTAPLRHRQYSSFRHTALTPSIRSSLHLILQFLRISPDREVLLKHSAPLILYTDASDVPGRVPQRLLGAVLFDPLDNGLFYSTWPVPSSLVSTWLPKKSFMGQLELLAAPFALTTWEPRITNRSILLFIDNDSAAASLVKGYSPQHDSASIVGEFWLLAASLRSHVYIDRVESKSNIADGPSRNDFTLVKSLGGLWSVPRTGTLGTPSRSPPVWFGTPSQSGG